MDDIHELEHQISNSVDLCMYLAKLCKDSIVSEGESHIDFELYQYKLRCRYYWRIILSYAQAKSFAIG